MDSFAQRMKHKKTVFWLVFTAILACVTAAVCFLTVPKKKQRNADFVGTWEFCKSVTDTYEEDFAILQAMMGMKQYEIVFREDGTGAVNLAYDSGAWETPFTYTVSGNTLTTRRTDERGEVVLVEYIYDPPEGTLHALVAEGEGNRWVGYFVRKGTVTYPSVQLTIDRVAGQWKSDGHPVTKGMPPSLSGTLSLDREGRASLHLYGDEGTEMTAVGTYSVDGSLLRIEPEEVSEPLKYHPWYLRGDINDLGMTNIHPVNETAATASYDPKTDTLRFYHWDFGVLTFYRDRTVTQWFDSYDFDDHGPNGPATIAVPSFPDVTFCCESDSWGDRIVAVEGDRTWPLLTGMPILNAFFTDLTGDGKPELCATVAFGSGLVDEHVIVCDYVNRQSYALCERGEYDYQLYLENGMLRVKKIEFETREQADTGILVTQDGVPAYQAQGDGSCTLFYRQLHESELYGSWIVREVKDDGNNEADMAFFDVCRDFDLQVDGVVGCSDPTVSAYRICDGTVFFYGADTSQALCWGMYDREKDVLEVWHGAANAAFIRSETGK